ncbi:PREDICTED: protein FAM179A-like [Ficedula albicollis]|uniref:protein FAM179A-like n=1 Tax=Ficedula albicollis TaxID=59894 RepID=UPI000359CD4A|nr:PREDICTED: protein FAM179A-like [Ficedula albicollis]
MDPEVDEVTRVLLRMVWNSPEFVEKAASQTLGIMVENVTPARAMTALLDSGVQPDWLHSCPEVYPVHSHVHLPTKFFHLVQKSSFLQAQEEAATCSKSD